MIGLPDGVRVYLAAGRTDLRRGIDGLAAQIQTVLREDPFSGHLFIFRGRAAHTIKVLMYDGSGFLLMQKRLTEGKFRSIRNPGAQSLSECLLRVFSDVTRLPEPGGGAGQSRPGRTWCA